MQEKELSVSFKGQAVFRMNESTERIEKCLKMLTVAQACKKPNESSNSIANLILHLCGNITQYILSSLAQEEDTRQRDLEFSTKWDSDIATLATKMRSTADAATAVIRKLPEEELLRKRIVQGFELDGIGIIMHVVEHYSYHTGQIALLTKLLVNKDLGFYDGMDLNVKNEG